MKIKHILTASAFCLGMIATPAMAQSIDADDGSSANDNTQIDDSILLDLVVALGNGNNRDNTAGNFDSVLDSSYAVADQTLLAVITNFDMDEVVDMESDDDDSGNYNSGDNYVSGNAYAAFAGISNSAWNSGINANTQAASNIAAVGTVSFEADD